MELTKTAEEIARLMTVDDVLQLMARNAELEATVSELGVEINELRKKNAQLENER